MSSRPSVSPYRRNVYNNTRKDLSPFRQQPSRLAEKSKLSHSLIADHAHAPTQKKTVYREQTSKFTDKKRYVNANESGYNRLDTLLEQNKYLLSENNQLSNLLNDRSRLILALQQKLEEQVAQEVRTLEEIEYEKNRFLDQYSQKMRENNIHNERLMDEIAQLNQDICQLQLSKNREFQIVRESLVREHKYQLENILTTHAQTIDLLQTENANYRECQIEKEQHIQSLAHQLKALNEKYAHHIQDSQKQITHLMHMKKLELSQQKIEYDTIIDSVRREAKKDQEAASLQYENDIKKVKKEVMAKMNQVQKLENEISSDKVESQIKIIQLNERKGELEKQITELQTFQRKLIFEETQRIKDLAETQLVTVQNTHKHLIDSLKSENARLLQTNELKSAQINKLHNQLDENREAYKRQLDDLAWQLQTMKQQAQYERGANQEQNEAFKIKMAQFRNADIESVRQYYDNQLATMAQDLAAKEEIILQTRQKVHTQIQQKTELRKKLQIKVSKMKVRIGELQMRLAGAITEKRQQLASFGSQMELTSMHLIRQSEQKQKYTVFSHSQKKKLQEMIDSKDKEIEQLNQKIHLMLKNHGIQIYEKDEEIVILKTTIEDLEVNLKKQKTFLENQIKKKETINRNDRQFYESELAKVKRETSEEYETLMTELNQQRSRLETEKSKFKQLTHSLGKQLSLAKEIHEREGLEYDVAMTEARNRLVSEKQILEVNLNAYHRKQLSNKDNEIKDLKQQLQELNVDIRRHIEKQQKLEQKIDKLLQTQQKLRQMEQRVLALGQQNNLVKNLAQIVKSRRK